jgi:hypothetical protein
MLRYSWRNALIGSTWLARRAGMKLANNAAARITTFPVMFAVKTRPSDKKLTASTRPVTAVIPRRAYGITFSVAGLLAIQN